jgi:hypothetical protein
VGRDGTLWLTWTRQIGVLNQIFYKTLANNVWSSEVQFTNDSNINLGSSVVVGRDNVVRVVWGKGAPSGNPQIFYRTLNGTTWSADSQIISSAYRDYHPSMIQSRDGSFWVFWTRVIPSGSVFTYKIFGKYSADNGITWPASTETQLTFDCCSRISTDEFPVAVQSTTDNTLRVYYSTNTANLGEFDIYELQSSAITSVHHVAVASIRPSSNWTYAGGFVSANIGPLVTVYVTVADPGDFLETVTINTSVSNTTVYNLRSRTATIVPGGSILISFTWNTTGAHWGRYALSANITPAPGTSPGNLGDKSLSLRNRLMVLPLGDVDQDGSVTITDVSVFFYNYGFAINTLHNGIVVTPFADVNGNGVIDIVDIGVASKNFDIFL